MAGDNIQGADPEKLRSLGTEFKKKSEELKSLMHSLNGKIKESKSAWTGPKADKVREDWDYFYPKMKKTLDSIDAEGEKFKNHAQVVEENERRSG